MGTYSPPVDRLLTLGRDGTHGPTIEYSLHGIGPEHVSELIRLLQDDEITFGPEPGCYAQIHAWRALAWLQAPEAVEPLLDLLAEQVGDDWCDWVTEAVPIVLAQFGPRIIPAVVARLQEHRRLQFLPGYFANALKEVAIRHEEVRLEVIAHLTRFLETASEHDPGTNGLIIGDLIDLKAAEAWPVIEQAFASNSVDPRMVGDAPTVKYELGLGPKPPPVPQWLYRERYGLPLTARDRAEKRKHQKQSEKKKSKKQGK